MTIAIMPKGKSKMKGVPPVEGMTMGLSWFFTVTVSVSGVVLPIVLAVSL